MHASAAGGKPISIFPIFHADAPIIRLNTFSREGLIWVRASNPGGIRQAISNSVIPQPAGTYKGLLR